MKSGINRVKTAIYSMGQYWCLHCLLVVLFAETVFFMSERDYLLKLLTKFRNGYPLLSLPFAEFHSHKGKNPFVITWIISKGQWTKVAILHQKDTTDHWLKVKTIHNKYSYELHLNKFYVATNEQTKKRRFYFSPPKSWRKFSNSHSSSLFQASTA